MKTNIFRYDYWLLFITLSLLMIGMLILASASMGISEYRYHTSLHFLFHQIIYLISGIFFTLFLIRLPLVFWEKVGGYLLIATLFLLVFVLVPKVGKEINGSIRWLGFGPFTLQVSELAKCCVVIFMAGYLVRRKDEVEQRFSGFLKPMVIVVLTSSLLLLEPDFGATVVIVFTVLGMMFLAGARVWQFMFLLLLAAVVLGALAISSPYRMMRLTSFLDPWATPFASGYQLTQSLIAFGRGGMWGVGLGNGIQKLFYLPEAHTDFLFAVLAEEFGIIGELVVLSLFALLVGRIFFLGFMAKKSQENFAAYLAYGLGLLLGLQVVINVGVNMGILPTKGLTLPFMSYGGSSMLFNCGIIAIVLRISHEIRGKTINH